MIRGQITVIRAGRGTIFANEHRQKNWATQKLTRSNFQVRCSRRFSEVPLLGEENICLDHDGPKKKESHHDLRGKRFVAGMSKLQTILFIGNKYTIPTLDYIILVCLIDS